ncbi:MAG: enoyl-CoA hydratase/isomerase family protein, partial [Planctomycetes bacterium]|nr:enoyl-CoA hydratase/isomerase family protein [Planctomycetota bacterium]
TADAPGAVITLNRPERRNAVNEALLAGLHAALDLALDDEAVRAVILTGAGSAFCSGLDVHEAASDGEKSFEDLLAEADGLARLFRRLRSYEKVTIAAVNGPALASGCGIATLCDFTLATGSARFGYPEVRVGFVPAVASVYLRYLVTQKRLRELLLTGRLLSADEALEMGMVNAVVPADDLLERSRDIAAAIARNAPDAIRMTKELLETLPGLQIDRALKAAVEYNARARAGLECREGVRAFIEKREPVWQRERGLEAPAAAPPEPAPEPPPPQAAPAGEEESPPKKRRKKR